MFWAWVHGMVDTDIQVQPQMYDIQQLNRIALETGDLALTKVSMATFLEPDVQERYRLLSSGAALGRACGPLIVTNNNWSLQDPRPIKLAIPGRNTTAFKLAQMALGPWIEDWVELRYDEIMPAVLDGSTVDAGLIIHESRFVYKELGLGCALDLGTWWEEETSLPLPLGVMLARKDLDDRTVGEVESNLHHSIALAREIIDPESGGGLSDSLWDYMRSNAIELENSTIQSHVELYVNEFSLDLGEEGRAAIQAFTERALS